MVVVPLALRTMHMMMMLMRNDVDADFGAGDARRTTGADRAIRRERLLALLRVQLSRCRPFGAHLVHAGMRNHRGGVGAELQVGVSVLMVVFVVEAPCSRPAEGQDNQASRPHSQAEASAALALLLWRRSAGV